MYVFASILPKMRAKCIKMKEICDKILICQIFFVPLQSQRTYKVIMLREFLNNILQLSSPSGSEESVTKSFGDYVSTFVDEVSYDVYGNCIAHKIGNGEKVMLVAHADEIGLIIRYIDDNGFLYFDELGAIDTSILPGQKVRISGVRGDVVGVIGKKPIHLQDKDSGNKELNPEDLWIDIAACDKKEALNKVMIGSTGTLVSEPLLLSNDIVVSRAMDDKIGLMVLAGVAQALSKIQTDKDIYFVASVQEELGARGVQTVTQRILPDVGIAIDVTHATDYPSMSKVKDGDIALNKGVVIPLGPNMHKELSERFMSITQEKHIPHQVEVFARPTGSDARTIQQVGTGIKTGLISIPCRYMHTSNEMVSLKDAESTIQLLSYYLQANK